MKKVFHTLSLAYDMHIYIIGFILQQLLVNVWSIQDKILFSVFYWIPFQVTDVVNKLHYVVTDK